MSDQFLGEIRIFAGNFAPYQWALCDGQLMAISQNTALFALLGVQFGGDGRVTFGLPNMQGVAPMDFGNGPGLTPRVIGESGGEPTVTLNQTQLASHSHAAACDTVGGNATDPTGNVWAEDKKGKSGTNYYSDVVANPVKMSSTIVGLTGGGQPHNNISPYLVATFIIALSGIFPQRS